MPRPVSSPSPRRPFRSLIVSRSDVRRILPARDDIANVPSVGQAVPSLSVISKSWSIIDEASRAAPLDVGGRGAGVEEDAAVEVELPAEADPLQPLAAVVGQ